MTAWSKFIAGRSANISLACELFGPMIRQARGGYDWQNTAVLRLVIMDQVQRFGSQCSHGHSFYTQSSSVQSSYCSKFPWFKAHPGSKFLQLQNSFNSKFLHFKTPTGAKFLLVQSSYWCKVPTNAKIPTGLNFLHFKVSFGAKFLRFKVPLLAKITRGKLGLFLG
jgi:hypothetical protein